MNEIEKMYENAGIEPERQDCCKIADKYWANNTESGFEYLMQKECLYNQECTDECEYAYDKVVYPAFTAEKQLELIKRFIPAYPLNFTYGFLQAYPFDEGLAHRMNSIWGKFTPKEKKQIKEILSK